MMTPLTAATIGPVEASAVAGFAFFGLPLASLPTGCTRFCVDLGVSFPLGCSLEDPAFAFTLFSLARFDLEAEALLSLYVRFGALGSNGPKSRAMTAPI